MTPLSIFPRTTICSPFSTIGGRPVCVLLLAALLLAPSVCYGKKKDQWYGRVMKSLFALSDTIAKQQWHYTARYYYRGAVSLEKKNAIIVSTPNRRFYVKGGKDLLTEDEGDMEYSRPNVFTRKVRHTYNAVPGYDVSHGYIMDFFNINLHGAYLLGDHLLSPLCRKNSYYYSYRCDSVTGNIVHFSFKRRRRNMQLVDGTFVYDMEKRYVTTISFSGRYNFVTFHETVTMGSNGKERYWPAKASLDFSYWYYGNVFTGKTVYTQRYNSISSDYRLPRNIYDKHDVTRFFALALDTAQVVTDSAFMARHRTVPLTGQEQGIYTAAKARKDSVKVDTGAIKRPTTSKWVKTLGSVGEFFFNDYDLVTTDYTSLRILSPNIGYSGSHGVSYRQDLEYVRHFKGGRQWSVIPRVSYYFKDKEMTGRMRSELLFQPRHGGMIAFEAGLQRITANSNNLFFIKDNGNGQDEVESLDFTDFYTHLDVSREIANGLDVSLGLLMHHRRPRGYASDHKVELGLRERYRDFAPRMTVTYTPGQNYYRVGDRKVTVGSKWPTIVLNYERGINGVMGSTNNYEKWEFTVGHGFRFTPVHRLIWKVGGGMFTDRKHGDFVQYEYFNNGITAYNWDDDRSGVFQLLDQKYYNNSYHYLRGHMVIESPMLILGNFSTRVVRTERLYANALITEGLVPYLEFGYGVSNELLDMSFFWSYIQNEPIMTGVKLSLHIFD